MKTAEQNQKEVETYLQKSSLQLFTEDDVNFQTVKMTKSGPIRIILDIKTGRHEVHPIDVDRYLKMYPTTSKYEVKRRLHPTNVYEDSTFRKFVNPSATTWYMIPKSVPKFKSVRSFPSIREKISEIVADFETKTTTSHNI